MNTQNASDGAPILKEVWDQFATYDTNAIREQAKFKQIQNWILIFGVIAVLLALIQTQIVLIVGKPESFTLWYEVLRGAIILAPILIAALIAISNQFKSGNKWIMLRSGAESLKREIFRYRAQAGIYSDEATQEKTREQKLADKLTQIRRQVMKTAVSETSLKPHGQTMPSDMGFLSSSGYIDARLEEQRVWYAGKTDGLEKKLRLLRWSTILIGGLGTLLAALGLELWVALTTALAAALVTYLEYTRTENTLVLYNQVVTDLKNIKTWWATLTLDEQALPSNHDLLVQQTEQALETEHSGWVQNMTEALAELQEQQAAMKERVKADVEAVLLQQAAAQEEALAASADDAEPEPPELEEGTFDQADIEEEIAAPELAPPAPEPTPQPEPAAPPPPMAFDLTEQLMAEILQGNDQVDAWFNAARMILPKYKMDTAKRMAGFLAQCMHESNNFTVLEENLNYSATRLNEVFPKYFINAGRDASEYHRNPEKIANVVYANRLGNTQPGDGFRFRGRGIIQLTGRANYARFGETIHKTAEQVVDYVQTKEGALESACWFWEDKNINRFADAEDIDTMTYRINGGFNGLADRKKKYKHARKVLGLPEEAMPTLMKGSHGPKSEPPSWVQALQKALGVGADGDFGGGTERALKKWQAENGLREDGMADPATLKKLLGST